VKSQDHGPLKKYVRKRAPCYSRSERRKKPTAVRWTLRAQITQPGVSFSKPRSGLELVFRSD
jgi:hypothetical protein